MGDVLIWNDQQHFRYSLHLRVKIVAIKVIDNIIWVGYKWIYNPNEIFIGQFNVENCLVITSYGRAYSWNNFDIYHKKIMS